MKILFIGGYGNISWYCTNEVVKAGHEVWILNRAVTRTTRRTPPEGVKEINVDIRDKTVAEQALAPHKFDIVADFICFNDEQAKEDIELFKNRTKQFVFISSEAIYQRKPEYLPFTENTPQYAPGTACSYIDGKVKAEKEFFRAYKEEDFPVAIVRPGYTYDTIMPVSLGHNCFTAPQRILDGKPVLIGGNGNSLWTFTHSSDFASAFAGLLGNEKIIGDAVHITSDFVYSWNDAMKIIAGALGIRNPRFLYIPQESVFSSEFGVQKEVALSKMFDAVFNNSKIKSLVPGWKAHVSLEEGLRQTVEWLYEDERRIRIVAGINEALEKLEGKYRRTSKNVSGG